MNQESNMSANSKTDQSASALAQVPIENAKRWPDLNYFNKIIYGASSLAKGMKITFGYLINTKTVVTQQYPENRETLILADRVRANLIMKHNENGYHDCTSCHICEGVCPNASIHVVDRSEPTVSKKELGYFVWRLDSCTFCNLCVMACPFSCLEMTGQFESSTYDQSLLVYNLNQYSGATQNNLAKLADDQARTSAIKAISPYEGPVALEGYHLAGIPKEFLPQKSDAKTSQAREGVNP